MVNASRILLIVERGHRKKQLAIFADNKTYVLMEVVMHHFSSQAACSYARKFMVEIKMFTTGMHPLTQNYARKIYI